ncbi:uncharacterized protein LOC124901483 [Homo sapiens]|uniref:uncharacterized protein LOC124901483 n=1 Tax=Homo sapiens TaxID=9606 RepID=UPI001FB0EEF3|nr:uncharacterized protein LOC124901483 [Homo sapiens]
MQRDKGQLRVRPGPPPIPRGYLLLQAQRNSVQGLRGRIPSSSIAPTFSGPELPLISNCEEEGSRWVRNVVAVGPCTRPATPCQGLSSRAEQRRREESFCPRLPRPALHSHQPTPLSETLQPTSPRVRARGEWARRRNRDNRIPGPEMPSSASPPGQGAPPLAPPVPVCELGDPRCQGERSTRFSQPLKRMMFL